MIRELRHRSGNLFAQLLALFSQTAKSSKNMAELVPKFEARVLALANAHRLITESGWRSASLMEISIRCWGRISTAYRSPVPMSSSIPIPTLRPSVLAHRLATNAS